MSDQTEVFLDEYKKLESLAEEKLRYRGGESVIKKLENDPEFRFVQTELRYCREVRNLLQHNPKVNGQFAVQPSEEMTEFLRSVIRMVEDAPLACDRAVPIEKVYYRSIEDHVRPALTEKLVKSYTDVPILTDGVVTGVFSENTLLSYLVDEQRIGIEKTTRFTDLHEYLPLGAHRSEVFAFAAVNAPLTGIRALFEQNRTNQKRLGMVFLTKSGRKQEKLEGIITAWDIAGVIRQ